MFSVGDLVTIDAGNEIYKINHINKKGYFYLIGLKGHMQICTIRNLKIIKKT